MVPDPFFPLAVDLAGSVPDYSGGTATEFRCQASVTVFPFHSHSVPQRLFLTPNTTHEYLNSVECTFVHSTVGDLQLMINRQRMQI